MKKYLAALISLDPVKTTREKRDAIQKEESECIQAAVAKLDRDTLSREAMAQADMWVEDKKKSPAILTDLVLACSWRVSAQDALSMIVTRAQIRRDRKIAELSPIVSAALNATHAKLIEQRAEVVAADAKRFEETEIDQPSTKTLALLDKKLEQVGSGLAHVKSDVQSALGYLFQAVDGRPSKPTLAERYMRGEMDQVSPGRDNEQDTSFYRRDGVGASMAAHGA